MQLTLFHPPPPTPNIPEEKDIVTLRGWKNTKSLFALETLLHLASSLPPMPPFVL